MYFISLFNKNSDKYKSVLVRDFEKVFLDDCIALPMKNGKIDFDYIDKYIKIQQKLVIKDVLNYKDTIIEKSKLCI